MGQPLAFGQRYGSDLPPELSVVEHGVAGIDAFAKAGGRFTGQKNAWGQTVAMLAAGKNAAVMEAFVRAGGTFSDDKDKERLTAAMYAVNCNLGRLGADHHDESIEAIAAFGRVGGKFTEDQDRSGETAATHVISWCPVDAIAVFVRAGGHFDNQPTKGYTAGMFAVQHGVEAIHAFVAAGGKFDSQQPNGQTARDMAAKAGKEVLKAYEDAVKQQGGLIYMSSDDEFSALKNPEAIESFVKAGGHFDDQPDSLGRTPAMRAVQRSRCPQGLCRVRRQIHHATGSPRLHRRGPHQNRGYGLNSSLPTTTPSRDRAASSLSNRRTSMKRPESERPPSPSS